MNSLSLEGGKGNTFVFHQINFLAKIIMFFQKTFFFAKKLNISLYFCKKFQKLILMTSIQEEQDAIVQEFEVFDDWLDRYEYLIEISSDLEPLEPKYKTAEYLVHGCQSRVWLTAEMHDGKLFYRAETDAIITKGIISLLIRALSGRKPDEIVNADLYFIDKIGLRQNLSPSRSNGLLAMVKQMKLYALAFKTKNEE